MATRNWRTPLSDAFFSDFNREIIHRDIISAIESKTGYTLEKQNDADLQALMKRVYVNLMADPSTDVLGQVRRMNKTVVDEATETINTGMLQQLLFMRDISTNPVPLEPPVSTSTYGNKLGSRPPIGF
jgi:hypothetical protein